MYEPKNNPVNRGLVKDLLDICNDFATPVKTGESDCMFCCPADGKKHEEKCPVARYKELEEKHGRWVRWVQPPICGADTTK